MSGFNLGEIVAHLKLEISEFTNSLNKAKSELASTGSKFDALTNTSQALTSVGKTITGAVTMPVIAAGAAAVKLTSEFNSSMSKVAALSGATGKELEALRDKAKEMGAATQFSATECADALSYMALAGWNTEESIAGLPGILNLAAASQMDLADASDMVTDYLSAFGMEASQAGEMADVLAYAQAKSNTTTQLLGDAFKNCAVNANAFGLDVQQTTALLGKLADQGLKGSEAGTALNAVFRDMSSKMKDGAIAIGDTNVKIVDAQGNFRDMADIVRDVTKATDGMSESEKMVALQSTFTADSIKAMGILCNTGADDIDAFTQALYGSAGAAEEMAEKMNDNLAGDIQKLKSAAESAAITIGEKLDPVLRKIVQAATGVINAFAKIPAPVLQVIGVIVGVIAVIGPLLLITGKLISAGISIYKTFMMLKTAFAVFKGLTWVTNLMWFFKAPLTSIYVLITDMLIPALGSLWAFMLANPITFVIAAIAALVAAFIWLWNNCEGFREFWINLWNTCKQALLGFYNENKQLFTNLVQAFKDLWAAITQIFGGFLTFLKGIFTGDSQLVVEGLKQMWNGLIDAFAAIWDMITNIFAIAWQAIKDIFEGNPIAENLIKTFEGMGEAIINICNGLITFLKGVFTGDMQMCADGLRQIWEGVKQWFVSIWNGIKNHFSMIWADMKSKVSNATANMKSAIQQFGTNAANAIRTACTNMINAVRTWVTNMGTKAREGANKFITTITSTLSSLPGKMVSIGTSICEGIASGIRKGLSWITSACSSVVNTVTGALKGIKGFNINSPSKLMRDEVGSSISEGIGVGIEKNVGFITEAVKSVKDLVMDSIDASGLTSGLANSNLVGSLGMSAVNANSMPGMYSNLYHQYNGKSTKEVDYDRMAETIGAYVYEAMNGSKTEIYMDKVKVGMQVAETVKARNAVEERRMARLNGEIQPGS